MRNLPYTFRQLEVFASLSSTNSFKRTAKDLGISQASVSNQIKSLEEQLGVKLFDRKPGQRPTLRIEGLDFRDDLREFERAAIKLAGHRKTNAMETEENIRFKILVGQGIFDLYMRPKLDQFFSSHQGIDIEFETQLPYNAELETMDESRFDFAIINQRANNPLPLGFANLARFQGGIYGHRKFAEGKQLPLTPEHLCLLPFIMPQANGRHGKEVLSTYQSHGIFPRKVVCNTQFFDVMATMLERGLGVASFSEAILSPHIRKDVIQLCPLDDWRLIWFRNSAPPEKRRDAVEQFLISSLLDDPDFPGVRLLRGKLSR